ncbi:MAG: ABC transporter ATP-binding protein/permease [Bulleidia sp.]
MMINRRLISTVPESRKYVAANVICQWISLISNIGMMGSIAYLINALYKGSAVHSDVLMCAGIISACIAIRCVMTVCSARMGYRSSEHVKTTLRTLIYEKLLRLGSAYQQSTATSEIVQAAVEGVDQLETYFGSYLPQFFYAMAAPLTLFAVLASVSLSSAVILLICVPLIPVSIIAVQKWAKKLLAEYWGQYTGLGDTFLENLQGLTTLKVYQADEMKQKQMNVEAEKFRVITMKVLSMQLNSITIMDLVAYGGAALGMITALFQYRAGNLDFGGTLFVILLSADFFIPMRLLGSFFHVAMNGMAASDRIFRLLDIEEKKSGSQNFPQQVDIHMHNVSFQYETDRLILNGIHAEIREGTLCAVVGASGCGKSTLAGLLTKQNTGYAGSIRIHDTELSDIPESDLHDHVTYIPHKSFIFAGTVRENLKMGNPKADDTQMWKVLDQVSLSDFLRSENGLDTVLTAEGANFSGGQRQRLALARALLHDTPVFIFDEAASNVDAESEQNIMSVIETLAKIHTVIVIAHRLSSIVNADQIIVMKEGSIVETGTHAQLLKQKGEYETMWNTQQKYESYGGNV